MVKINENYLRLPPSYLFSEIARRAREFQAANPGAQLLRLGIGNTTEPPAPVVIEGLHARVDKLPHLDLTSLRRPNHPPGAVATRAQLKRFVGYALEHEALIVFDAAYEIFIRAAGLPRSIYAVPGARRCAVELGTFSKEAGFTGVR